MEMSDLVGAITEYLGAVFLLFPVGYIFFKGGTNKFLFLACCIGVLSLLQILAFGIVSPLIFLDMKVFPVFVEAGYMDNIMPLLSILNWVQQFWFIFSYPLLLILLPILIYRRYPLFHLTSFKYASVGAGRANSARRLSKRYGTGENRVST